jgi:hypothetical protein
MKVFALIFCVAVLPACLANVLANSTAAEEEEGNSICPLVGTYIDQNKDTSTVTFNGMFFNHTVTHDGKQDHDQMYATLDGVIHLHNYAGLDFTATFQDNCKTINWNNGAIWLRTS